MSDVDVTIPFVDIINIIIILEKDNHQKESHDIVKDVVRSYSGHYKMLEEDINSMFGEPSKQEIILRYPEEYRIPKKVFGAIIWSD